MIHGLRVAVHLTSRDALRIFHLADIWAARTGQEVRLVSGNDHVHSRGSAHYLGEALDFHSSDPDALAETFRASGYRVLWKVKGHFAHVHVEQVSPTGSPMPQFEEARQAGAQSSSGGPDGRTETRQARNADAGGSTH